MSSWRTVGAGGRAILLTLGAIGILGLGYMVWQLARLQVKEDQAGVQTIAGDGSELPVAPETAAPETAAPEVEPASGTAEPPVENVAAAGDMAAAEDVTAATDEGTTAEPVAPEPEAASAAEVVAPVPETASADAAAQAAPEPPKFDNWRVASDGAAVVAGRAAPLAKITVLVNGLAVAETESTASGEFAALFTFPHSETPSMMSLKMVLTDGTVIASDQIVAVEAVAGPVIEAAPDAVASVEPEPAPTAGISAEPGAADPVPAAEAVAPPVSAESEAATAPAQPDAAAQDELAIVAPDGGDAVTPPAAPAAILITEEGALASAGQTVVDPVIRANVSLDTIAYTPGGDVQLGGHGTAGQYLRIYLDNEVIKMMQVPASGQWLTTLHTIRPGIYTMRIDQLDDKGTVTSRFETPFKRETREALAALAAQQPASDPVATPAPAEVPTPEVAEASSADTAVGTDAAVVAAEPEILAAAEPAVVPDPVPAAEPTVLAEGASGVTAAPAAAAPVVAPDLALVPVTVTVQPGYTLWGIAKENFGEGILYVQVFEANKAKIKDPDLIYPGQVFVIPK